MHMVTRITPVALLLMLTSSCQAPPEAEEPMAARTAQEVEADLDALSNAWISRANEDDAAGVATLYMDDALYVGASGDAIQGRDQIQAYLEEAFPDISSTVSERTAYVMGRDLVVGYGTYSSEVADEASGDGVITNTGRWVTVSEYQPDGSLRIRLHQSTWTN